MRNTIGKRFAGTVGAVDLDHMFYPETTQTMGRSVNSCWLEAKLSGFVAKWH